MNGTAPESASNPLQPDRLPFIFPAGEQPDGGGAQLHGESLHRREAGEVASVIYFSGREQLDLGCDLLTMRKSIGALAEHEGFAAEG